MPTNYDSLLPSFEFILFYRIFLNFSLLFSTLSILIQATIVLKASSKQMGSYKWMLLNEAGWNFLFELTLSLYQWTPTLPTICGYSSSMLFGKHGWVF
jgi:hypothetical protein